MVNQGEIVNFKGYFQQQVDGEWQYITPLKEGNTMIYDVTAMVVNESRNKKKLFATNTKYVETVNITIEDSETLVDSKGNKVQLYCFTLSAEDTAAMLGECSVEVSLISYDSSDTTKSNPIPLITDNKGIFVIKDSLLGRTIASK